MKSRNLPMLALAVALFCLLSARGAAMTNDEAEGAARQSGRPILAVAGRQSCGLTQAVLGHLKEPALLPLVSQYVYLSIDVDGPDWASWTQKYGRPDGTTLPFVYVLRADGEKLFSHSGVMDSNEIRQLLAGQAAKAGKPLSAKEAAVVQKAMAEAKQAYEKGDAGEAVKSLVPLKKLGLLGSAASYAKAAVDANALVAKLTKEGKAMLKEADEKLSAGDPSFAGALGYARAKRIYTPLTTLKTELAAASRKYERLRDLADLFRQAEALDRAQALALSPHGKAKAADAFQRIVSTYPDSEAAKAAAEELKKLAGGGAATASKETPKTASRTWADATGRFSVKARCRGVEDGQAVLETDEGRVLRVPVEKLSEPDREFLKSKPPTE